MSSSPAEVVLPQGCFGCMCTGQVSRDNVTVSREVVPGKALGLHASDSGASIATSTQDLTSCGSQGCFASVPTGASSEGNSECSDIGFRHALPALLGGSSASASKKDIQLLKTFHAQWSKQLEGDQAMQRRDELEMLMQQTREQMLVDPPSMPASRYGTDATLPTFDAEKHVPTLALINPGSGAKAGADIMALARKTPYYQRRFFNIVDVVRDQRRGGLLDVFRLELTAAKEEARARGVRPRLISGGGDGTASFALFMVFLALKADPTREGEGLEDRGNGLVWDDADLEAFFPAVAQLPLGSANDFGHTLGWGHRYPGDRAAPRAASPSRALGELSAWLLSVLDPDAPVASFDVWGIMPPGGEASCDFKVCELAGPRGADPRVLADDGQRHLVMKEADTPVPLFCCLYFSVGFFAYMTSRFQLNRHSNPRRNKLEYARQALGIVREPTPPELGRGLERVQVACGGEAYFPPRGQQAATGARYREVGFLNVNWQGGIAHGADRAPAHRRMWAAREPAKFNDGQVDMYRMKLSSPLRMLGTKYQTDKRTGPVTISCAGGSGQGVFFQWDGEARFAFSPTGEPFSIDVRKILNLPVVLGPGYDAKVTGAPDNGDPVRFGFEGATAGERSETRHRILRCVRGELDRELNATREEMAAAGLHCKGP
uniref:DAGKc domain-containing protein n=1 Tax=Zooxanthella nutricula TaxID=1333877 RepID=A0A7S2IL92_9DINO